MWHGWDLGERGCGRACVRARARYCCPSFQSINRLTHAVAVALAFFPLLLGLLTRLKALLPVVQQHLFQNEVLVGRPGHLGALAAPPALQGRSKLAEGVLVGGGAYHPPHPVPGQLYVTTDFVLIPLIILQSRILLPIFLVIRGSSILLPCRLLLRPFELLVATLPPTTLARKSRPLLL